MSDGATSLQPESAPAVAIRDLRKSFGSLEVLKGVSLSAREGDVVSILGASGSGKSTMLRCINMLEVPDGGHVEIGGETIRLKKGRKGMAPADQRQVDRIRSRVAMVFQSFNLWSHMTILENVIEAPVHVQKRPKAECVAEAEELLAKVGIVDKRNQYPSHLSGGQQQRAAIARAMVQRAQLVLADEPIASLDPEAARRVMESLAELNRADGVTVLVSLHQVQFAMRYCPRTVALRDGKVVFDGPSAALTPEKLGELYGAEAEELLL
ncbi:MAG TPA: ATP-binding cassette domain-containing protein, partial [Microvirga sp.]|nr:ATP-binding cassette domain-containing protein [Microvirga sp.]